MNTRHVTVPIDNLSCGGGGSLTIERMLVHSRGVTYAYVNPLTEMAYIEYDPGLTSIEHLITAIEHLGFRVGLAKAR